MKRKSKYRAKATVVDGIRFASKKEARRYQELKLLEQAGEIAQLELQPAFSLYSKAGDCICKYKADFAYVEKGTPQRVIEDVKGMKTSVYKIKAKWFQADYPEFEFRET